MVYQHYRWEKNETNLQICDLRRSEDSYCLEPAYSCQISEDDGYSYSDCFDDLDMEYVDEVDEFDYHCYMVSSKQVLNRCWQSCNKEYFNDKVL